MTFDVNDTLDSKPAPAEDAPRVFAGKYELGDPATPARVRKAEPKYPREAKISFAVGISLIVLIGLIPVIRVVMNSLVKPDGEPAPATTAPASSTSSSGEARVAQAGGGGGYTAGNPNWRGAAPAPASTGDAPAPKTRSEEEEAVPMTPAAYETLKRLWRYIYEMSHLQKNAPTANPKEGDWFAPEMLEGTTDEALKNLTLVQLRVAHQPLLGLRVLSEEHNLGVTTFQLEVISMGPGELEVSASTRIDLAVAPSEEAMRIVRFERLGAFEDGTPHAEEGAAPDAATSEPPSVRAGRLPPPRSVDGNAQPLDTRYPFTIR